MENIIKTLSEHFSPQKYLSYEFMQVENYYLLLLNGEAIKRYPKRKFSKQEAEYQASKEVGQAIKKYGRRAVYYDGCMIN